MYVWHTADWAILLLCERLGVTKNVHPLGNWSEISNLDLISVKFELRLLLRQAEITLLWKYWGLVCVSAGTDASGEVWIILDPSPTSLECCCILSPLAADEAFREVVTEKFQRAACFLTLSPWGNGALLNEDSCFNLSSILPSFPPSRQIYLPLRQPRPPYLSQQPFLLAWHLCLCSAVIVDLYFDSMHLRILLMCVFYLCVRAHCWLYVCTSLPVCVCC